jgi:hypothetical protein
MAPFRVNSCLIVCERSPRWLALWRSALPERAKVARGTGGLDWQSLSPVLSLAQCEGQLRQAPGSVAAVAVDDENLPAVLEHLHRWSREFPAARFLALCSAGLARQPTALALLREAGALLTIDRAQQLLPAARLVQRLLRRQPAQELPLRESLWQRLPWQRWAVQSLPPAT